MSFQLAFDGSIFREVSGYRFAMVLSGGGALSAALQVVLEDFAAQPGGILGRTQPLSFLIANMMPAVPAIGAVTIGMPSKGALSSGLNLTGFQVASIDRQVVGEYARLSFDFRGTPGFNVVPTVQPAAPPLGVNAAGMVRFGPGAVANANWKPVRDIDSSGKVLSWRTDRCVMDDPIARMLGWRGAAWDVNPEFNWTGVDAAAQSAKGGVAMTVPGMVYEELAGRYCALPRWRAYELERAFATPGGVGSLLRCDLDVVVPKAVHTNSEQGYQPDGRIEERVSIVFSGDIKIPVW
ncbi:hypothetical protein [Humisphaera borealis]|uniref:Uncharacterized protein n=1 Tax=Humisphaera borealis TaxID=2807512 RepID=A0A7M2WXQ1_9BACT|nr:hypothetical protein [Humisphaera borealis]QOV90189.1 hypothetical protein IPV69_02105 [Humisphaera borealis]